ncbi:hypothetical protein GCM10009601_43240 [Streptomyces thermospinosisporus]|uniref:DUF6545 domain-containing protein n=1 Tax=Streptomyces thermospinosisporus TaxID=161482 RepID=A0ABN1Z2M6_9ACTN
MSPRIHIPYTVPTLLLALALLCKFPTLLRAWRDPHIRATTALLACATAVLVVITPVNIHRLNVWTGVPNIAAPWAYSFLTGFCAAALIMIIRWREAPSERRRRRMIAIYCIYGGVIVALWVTFLLADVPEPRVYDLDTYYATTPWMREHTLLYVLAHMVSCLVTASMLWTWFSEISNRWIKWGVVLLQAGYATGLVFDACKLIAVAARWTGNDLDILSTHVAPPFALTQACLVALGFLVPQVGPFLRTWSRDQREHLRLRPLWRTVRVVRPAAAPARFGWWAPLDLRLMQRQQRIHDALRLLAPYFDPALYERVHAVAAAGHDPARARGIAGAVAIRAAVEAYRAGTPRSTSDLPSQIGPAVTDHIDDISRSLYRPRTLDRIRQRVTSTESVNAHA